MKKIKVLFYLLLVFCLFSTIKVNADARPCSPFDKSEAERNLTEVKLHYENKQAYTPGEKVYLDLKGVERGTNNDIAVVLKSTDASNLKIYTVYLKNIVGNDTTGAYFVLPDDPEHMPTKEQYEIWKIVYYKTTDEVSDYGYTPSGEKVNYYKELCATYYTKEEDANNDSNAYFLNNSYGKFVLNDKKPEARNILESITLDKNSTYFGGKMTFTVKTTEPIKNAYLTFTDRSKSGPLPFFTVSLISDGTSNEFTYTVNAPTYGINNVYDGNYTLEEIVFYTANNNKLTYNTNKDKAEEYNDKYVEYDLKLLLGKPINDIIKESQFELKGLKLVKNEVKVSDKVNVDFDYYYNSPSLKIQSVMLSFADDENNNMFSAYLKEINRSSSIIIPSNATEGTYKIKNVTITFDSYVGETNAVILDKDTIGDSGKSIFEQELTIKENKDAGLYFLAEELYQTSYETIKNAKENSIIIINANGKSIIPAELFDAIKESSKQLVVEYNKNEWVFNGVDIENSKPVDVSMKFYSTDKLESNAAIKKVIGGKGIVLEFPENGDLPGKALIRIKDESIHSQLQGSVYFIYHIDEENNTLNKVAVELQKSSDGYIEFYINHNSKYVITTEEIKDDSVLGEDDDVAKVNNATNKEESKDDNNKTNVLYFALGACVAVIFVLLVVVMSKSKKEKPTSKKEKNEEEKKEDKEE